MPFILENSELILKNLTYIILKLKVVKKIVLLKKFPKESQYELLKDSIFIKLLKKEIFLKLILFKKKNFFLKIYHL